MGAAAMAAGLLLAGAAGCSDGDGDDEEGIFQDEGVRGEEGVIEDEGAGGEDGEGPVGEDE